MSVSDIPLSGAAVPPWAGLRWVRRAADPLPWLILLFTVVVLLAPLLATHDPVKPDVSSKLQPPSREHYFGTDTHGMDVYSRVLYATRADFLAAFAAVLLGVAVGFPLGALSGYVGGLVDDVLNRLVEVIQAMPQFLFAMAVLTLIGSGVQNLILVLAFFVVPGYLKLVRSIVLGLRENDFVLAARCAGASTAEIVLRHLLPNTVAPFFGLFSISCAYAIQNVVGLSFLGLGVRVPQPEWGAMINQGAPYAVFGQWWPSVFPGLAIFLGVLMLRQLGERARQRYTEEV